MTLKKSETFQSLPVYNPEPSEDLYTRPYANNESNSRIPVLITDKLWDIRWQTAIDPFFPARFILTAKGNFIIQAVDRWYVLDSEGELTGRDFLGNSDIVFDPERKLFYYADRFGNIAAINLSSRKKAFSMQVHGLEDVERKYFCRIDHNFLLAEKSENKNPHDPSPLSFIYLEAYIIDEPPIVENGNLTSYKELYHTYYYTNQVAAASNLKHFVYSVENKIVIAGKDLKSESEFEDQFKPVSLSLDESGRIYMTVLNSENKLALRVITPGGDLIVDSEIPVEDHLNSIPPIIGYNHEIFLVFDDQVFSFTDDGKLKWQTYTDGKTGGAIVTSDNKLLLSEGSSISQFDEEGERQFIFQFPGENITTCPVITKNNNIIVAAGGNIYLLTPHK